MFGSNSKGRLTTQKSILGAEKIGASLRNFAKYGYGSAR